MKTGVTELVFILDRSGSMCGLEKDTIGGFNAMLEKQKAVAEPCRITTVLFNDEYVLLHDREEIATVQPISEKDYQVGGSTALLDAIGRTIHRINTWQKEPQGEGVGRVMVVIITDGEENSSQEYSLKQTKTLVEQTRDQKGWEFIFLGANIDAIETAGQFGISADRAQDYHADTIGVELNFAVMSEAVVNFRKHQEVPNDWNKEIQDDYKKRTPKD